MEYTGTVGEEGASTCTCTVDVNFAVVPVTEMVLNDESPPVDKVAVTLPVASVLLAAAWTAPDDAENVIGTPARTLLDASRANAVIVAVVEPSSKIDEAEVAMVNDDTTLVVADDVATTCTLTEAVSPEAVAVTVMTRTDGSPAVLRVATAAPVASVVALVIATPPESAANETTTPEIRSLDALRANTVMVAGAEPSEGIDAALEVAVSDAAFTVVVVPVPVPVVPVEPLLVLEVPPLSAVELPPHAASNMALIPIRIANLRIYMNP